MKFPEYVGFGSAENPHSCLRLNGINGNIATYERPPSTGCWKCDARLKDGTLVVTDCLGSHLIGKTLYSVTEEQFNVDNGFTYANKKE